jgi:hypothetical protein
MGEDFSEALKRIIDIHQREMALYRGQVRALFKWMKVYPALPCNEMAQAAEHYLNMVQAVSAGDMANAAIEAERARKHVAIATHDSIATLLRSHLTFLQYLVTCFSSEIPGSVVTEAQALIVDIERVTAKLDPPTEQKRTLEETMEDIDAVHRITVKKQGAVKRIQDIYEKQLAILLQPADFLSALQSYQASLVAAPQPFSL